MNALADVLAGAFMGVFTGVFENVLAGAGQPPALKAPHEAPDRRRGVAGVAGGLGGRHGLSGAGCLACAAAVQRCGLGAGRGGGFGIRVVAPLAAWPLATSV